MAIAIRTTAVEKSDGRAIVEPTHGADPLRTQCLTPLALTLGLIMWALIIALVRI